MRYGRWGCGVIAVALTSCGEQQRKPAAPVPVVDVQAIATTSVPNIVELPGRVEAVRTAEVRARTDGIVLQRLYEEGQSVAKGAPLFQLDPRDYRAQVSQSMATLRRYEATRDNAQALVNRYTPLAQRRAVSGQEFDQARSDLAQAQAQVAEARATLARSQLQLSFTTIRAPIAGVASRAEITEGALVTASQSTLMTRIDQTTPVYAVFSASSSSILDTTRDVKSGELSIPASGRVQVALVLENGQEYQQRGTLDFTAPVVDPTTGSQLVRARFDNGGRMLKPGQFVTGRIYGGTIQGGIVVPARAVQMKNEQGSVSLVAPDGSVISRQIALGQLLPTGWIIKSGLKKGDRLIVDGWQKARPGQKVNVRQAGSPSPVTSPSSATGR